MHQPTQGTRKRGTKRRGGRVVQAKRLERVLGEFGLSFSDLEVGFER